MSKKKKVINILFLIVFVSAIIFLVFRIAVSSLAFHAILFGKEIEEEIYYDSPNECIIHSIEKLPANASKDREIVYDKSIYAYENKKQYVEFFIDNHNSIWCYITDKITEDDKVKFCKNTFESDVQLGDYYWHNRGVYYYKIVDDKKKIENYEGREPEVIEFQLNYNDEIRTYYLLFIAADKQP